MDVSRIRRRDEALRSLPRPVPLHVPAGVDRAVWMRPLPGWIKINFDGLVRRSIAGFGMVARDVEGEILPAAAALSHVLIQSAGIAEALCLRWAMQLAIDLGVRPCV